MLVWPRRWVRRIPPVSLEMRKRAFDPFAALAHQAAAASSPHPATIAIHRRPGLGILRPITSPPVRLGHVGPDTHGVQVDQGLIAVIPLLTDDLFQRLPIVNGGLRVFDLPLRRVTPPEGGVVVDRPAQRMSAAPRNMPWIRSYVALS